ncbi:unnamed protein product [Miscanthus lutarioriparius]|uniref:Uncharacterized protein n=1 Tax=Miscanthus lutarioriparius TaxID=422564 RepID=A0A811MIK1_9POAL|nr:unnamed protein product [Miscanthus lutarioriparius]
MALKMAGCTLSVDTFARYYETRMHKKVIKDKRTKSEMIAHYGSYNFVSKKTRGTVSIVPAYRNKWPRWMNYWFYHRVCSDEDVVKAVANDLPKAHIMVSQMVPMEGLRLAEFQIGGKANVAATDAFGLTSHWQIN